MARRRIRIPLNVYLNGRLVGQLHREGSGAVDFKYADEWLERRNAIPVSLSLPLREDRFIGGPVIAVFENLLPDNDDIRHRLAERSKADGTDVYSLLSAIGRDCVGALQFIPEDTAIEPIGPISAKRLSDKDIAAMLGNLKRSPLGIGDDDDFRISLAGAQEKTALLYWKDAWYLPHGTTPTTHIFKPQIGKLSNGIDLSQSVENEHLCMQLVEAFGLPVAQSEIGEFGGRRVLIVERFDRFWTRDKRLLRVPQEDSRLAGMPRHRRGRTFPDELAVGGLSGRSILRGDSGIHRHRPRAPRLDRGGGLTMRRSLVQTAASLFARRRGPFSFPAKLWRTVARSAVPMIVLLLASCAAGFSGQAYAQSAVVAQSQSASTADPFARFVIEAAHRFGVPASWIGAVMAMESGGDVLALSPQGAMGLMQIMPDTWAGLRVRHGLGADPYEPRDNILAGAAYLREMHDRYGSPGFLAAYNAGPARYDEYLATGRELPTETQLYVAMLVPLIEEGQANGMVTVSRRVMSWKDSPLFAARDQGSPPVMPPSPRIPSPRSSASGLVTGVHALAPQADGLFVRRWNAKPLP